MWSEIDSSIPWKIHELVDTEGLCRFFQSEKDNMMKKLGKLTATGLTFALIMVMIMLITCSATNISANSNTDYNITSSSTLNNLTIATAAGSLTTTSTSSPDQQLTEVESEIVKLFEYVRKHRSKTSIYKACMKMYVDIPNNSTEDLKIIR